MNASAIPQSPSEPSRVAIPIRPRSSLPPGRRTANLHSLASAVVCVLGAMIPLGVSGAPLWDENDFVVSSSAAIVVLDENYQFKAVQCFCGPYSAGAGFGSLDWFGNGDLLVGLRFNDSPVAFRYDRNGVQERLYSGYGRMGRTADYKVSFNQSDMIVGGFGGGVTASLGRYELDPVATRETASFSSYGGVAVVPRLDGSHELWVAFESDFGGVRIYSMDATGRIDLTGSTLANPSVPAGSVTMTYDPATRRVLLSNMPGNQVFALDAETRALARTYTVPAGQSEPGVVFTGITSGPNGTIVAVESYEIYEAPFGRRVGLSVWDSDGSNYRFINLDNLPGFDLYVPSGPDYAVPFNVLWTGNSPEFRNGPPSVTCAAPTLIECVSPAGEVLSVTAAVSEADPGQTLTVTLEEGGTVLQEQSLPSPADAALVVFDPVMLAPGDHVLTVRVSDGQSAATCESHVTLQPRTGPVLLTSPEDSTVECTGDILFGTPTFFSSCDEILDVSFIDSNLPTSGVEKTRIRRTWTAVDDDGQSVSTSQTISVVDTVAPQFTSVPGDMTVETAAGTGAPVNYPPAAASDDCGPVTIQYSAASGSVFPIGTTTVTCTAMDAVGNAVSASFSVTVKSSIIDPPPAPDAITQLDALIRSVQSLPIPMLAKSILQLNLATAKALVLSGHRKLAAETLKVFESTVDALLRLRQLNLAQATPLKTASSEIRALLNR